MNSTDSLNSTLLGKKDWVADLTFTRRACACVLLVNVQHIKVVPDARQILRTLLRGGLDSREPRWELRDLNRNGAILVQQRGAVSNRIEKVLEPQTSRWLQSVAFRLDHLLPHGQHVPRRDAAAALLRRMWS